MIIISPLFTIIRLIVTAYDGKEIETQACVKFGLEEKHNIVDSEAAKKPAPNAYYPLLSSPRNDMNVPT